MSYLGKEYRIASVEVLKAFDQSPHHYEVMLE
ncbi:minor capsid protein [Streptococcus equi subsp. equi]|nr:minor capsid protein [Streptococcus equi subsp. equi]